MIWNDRGVTYKDIFYQSEKEFSKYNFELANTKNLFSMFNILEEEAKHLLNHKLALPAYDQCLKASHVFNILDARGAISIAQRSDYISKIRDIVKEAGEIWLKDNN